MNFVDGLLGRATFGLFVGLMYLSFSILSLGALCAVPIFMFEYGEGFNDLDVIEIVTLVLLILVIWRYVWRCRQQCWGWWRQVRRFGFVVASITLIESFILMVLALSLSETRGDITISIPKVDDDGWTLISNMALILCIYAAAPLPKLFGHQIEESAADDLDPEQEPEQPQREFNNTDSVASSTAEQP